MADSDGIIQRMRAKGVQELMHNKQKTVLAAVLACIYQPSWAQIVTDGSMGNAVSLSGSVVTIAQDLGTRVGDNLFHSFETFNVNSGQGVQFTGDAAIANVISRVTGDGISTIAGTLVSNIGQANVYLINPNGVVFGSGAQVYVSGSFIVATGDALTLDDGGVFSTDETTAVSSLTMGSPESFGFMGDSAGAIKVDGANLYRVNNQLLSFRAGSDVVLLGRDIDITNGSVVGVQDANISLLAAGASEHHVSLAEPSNLNGNVNISASASVFALGVQGVESAALAVNGGTLSISGALLSVDNFGTAAAPADSGLIVQANEINLSGGAQVTSYAKNTGAASDISIAAESLTLADMGTKIAGTSQNAGKAAAITITLNGELTLGSGTRIDADGMAAGDGGYISLTADSMQFQPGSRLTVGNVGTGNAGIIDVNASKLVIAGAANTYTGIAADAEAGAGNAGKLSFTIAQNIDLLSGATISTTARGAGAAGSISVNAGNLTLDHQDAGAGFETALSSQAQGSGAGGDVTITLTGDLALVGGAQVDSSTFGDGRGGNVWVSANNITLDGENNAEGTGIGSQSQGSGNAGDVTVTASGQIAIYDGAQINSDTFVSGKGGAVTVTADDIVIDGRGSDEFTGITSLTDGDVRVGGVTDNATGDGGTVQVSATTITLRDAGTISTKSVNGSSGNAGAVSVSAERVSLYSQGQISSLATGAGAAGNVSVSASEALYLENADINTEAADADGGDVSISSPFIWLKQSLVTTSVYGQGDGGDISVTTPLLLMDSGFVQANTAGVGSSGGEIFVDTRAIVPSFGILDVGGSERLTYTVGRNVIQAAAPDGVNGDITVTSPQLDISAQLAELDMNMLNLDDVAWGPCARSDARARSRLSQGGSSTTQAWDLTAPYMAEASWSDTTTSAVALAGGCSQ